jgi:hypothetical protein
VSDDRNERMMARAQHYANGGLSQVDQLRAELQLEHAKNDAWHKRGEVLQAEVERLKAELDEPRQAKRAERAEAENDRLRAELKCHAASEQGSVVANRKPGSPKDPQAETPVEAVRRFQRDYPLDTSDPYTKLFAIAELRTAQLRELREAAEDARETLRQLGWKPVRLDAVLAKVKP